MVERRVIAVRGIVQGVGFRPFVYNLASALGLGGFVRNQTGDVLIDVQGDGERVERFLAELRTRPPALARITSIDSQAAPPRGNAEQSFQIQISHADAAATAADVSICPDIATCDDCLAELFDPTNRRFRYPFTNCTNCGPRLTIIRGTPYDRPQTTMRDFPMCARCRREYDDPRDRRFHAQPTCCAVCGPRLRWLNAAGRPISAEPLEGPAPLSVHRERRGEGFRDRHNDRRARADCSEPSPNLSGRTGRGERGERGAADPLAAAVAALRSGKIVAIKGLGGFHLACDARNESAVRELRRRKQRDDKPFAVMARDAATVEAFCQITQEERSLLQSRARPIVLLRRKTNGPGLAESVAPGNPAIGVMLPYTPLHHLLLHDLGDGAVLVMTSGNRSDEPIAYDDADAVRRLRGIADFFLTHNRPIHVRCDDSVTQISSHGESPIRRSRGYAPQPIDLAIECPEPILAVGGQLKATFALGRGKQAILSHHLGDLDHLEALRAFERDVELYEESFRVTPRVIAHDLHPDYASTRYAIGRRDRENVRLLAVQHHHAHIASCMAEHGVTERVIGVSFDGTGYGTDGAIWGGEFLIADLADFRRAAHLRYVPLPGGEKAIKEPWRMALAYLDDAGVEAPPTWIERIDRTAIAVARQAIARRLNAPMTSSAGRLFDAVASLCGVRDRVTFEGQAAMELQWLAEQRAQPNGRFDDPPYEISLATPPAQDVWAPMQVDVRPMIRAIAHDLSNGVDTSIIASCFHASMSHLILVVCNELRKRTGIAQVALSGGVLMNSLLAERVELNLESSGFCALRHRRVPPNDGGLSLGQIAVAARRLQAGGNR